MTYVPAPNILVVDPSTGGLSIDEYLEGLEIYPNAKIIEFNFNVCLIAPATLAKFLSKLPITVESFHLNPKNVGEWSEERMQAFFLNIPESTRSIVFDLRLHNVQPNFAILLQLLEDMKKSPENKINIDFEAFEDKIKHLNLQELEAVLAINPEEPHLVEYLAQNISQRSDLVIQSLLMKYPQVVVNLDRKTGAIFGKLSHESKLTALGKLPQEINFLAWNVTKSTAQEINIHVKSLPTHITTLSLFSEGPSQPSPIGVEFFKLLPSSVKCLGLSKNLFATLSPQEQREVYTLLPPDLVSPMDGDSFDFAQFRKEQSVALALELIDAEIHQLSSEVAAKKTIPFQLGLMKPSDDALVALLALKDIIEKNKDKPNAPRGLLLEWHEQYKDVVNEQRNKIHTVFVPDHISETQVTVEQILFRVAEITKDQLDEHIEPAASVQH